MRTPAMGLPRRSLVLVICTALAAGYCGSLGADSVVDVYHGMLEGVQLASWGNGTVEESTEQPAFSVQEGAKVLKVTADGLYAGARLDLAQPIDLGPFLGNRDGAYVELYVKIVERLPEQPPTGVTSAMGYPPGYGQPSYPPGYGQPSYPPGYGQPGYGPGPYYGEEEDEEEGPPWVGGGGPPGYGGYPPGYGQPPGGYPPDYGGYPPGYGGYPPGYGQPPTGGYPPGYGQPPGGYPPGYGGETPYGGPPGAPTGPPGYGGPTPYTGPPGSAAGPYGGPPGYGGRGYGYYPGYEEEEEEYYDPSEYGYEYEGGYEYGYEPEYGYGYGAQPMLPPEPPKNIERVQVLLVGDGVTLATPATEVSEDFADAKGWVRLDVPFSEIGAAGDLTVTQIKQIAITGDADYHFYVGALRLIQEDQPLTASISGPQQAQVGQEVTFRAGPQQGGIQGRYAWDFDDLDGIGEQDLGEQVTWSFDEAGYYKVTLTVTEPATNKVPRRATHSLRVTE